MSDRTNTGYSIATTSRPAPTFPIIRLVDGERVLSLMRWGLVPCWAKDTKIGYKTIDVRAEMVAANPASRAPGADNSLLLIVSSEFRLVDGMNFMQSSRLTSVTACAILEARALTSTASVDNQRQQRLITVEV
jgi:hypothetical protein